MADTGIAHGTDDWKLARCSCITGTDVGVIFGVDKYSTPTKLLKEKRAKVTDSMADAAPVVKQALMLGREYEPAAIQAMLLWRENFAKLYDHGFVPSMHCHRDFSWLSGSPDYIFPASRTLAEIKTHWVGHHGQIDRDDVAPFPDVESIKLSNYLQIQTYLEIMDYDLGWLVSWTQNRGYTIFQVSRDRDFFQGMVIPRLRTFYELMQDCVRLDLALRCARMSRDEKSSNHILVHESMMRSCILMSRAEPI